MRRLVGARLVSDAPCAPAQVVQAVLGERLVNLSGAVADRLERLGLAGSATSGCARIANGISMRVSQDDMRHTPPCPCG